MNRKWALLPYTLTLIGQSQLVQPMYYLYITITHTSHTGKQRKLCSVLYMAIFTKYSHKMIPNDRWEWPLGIEFCQWVFHPYSGRNSDYNVRQMKGFFLNISIRQMFLTECLCYQIHTCSVPMHDIVPNSDVLGCIWFIVSLDTSII